MLGRLTSISCLDNKSWTISTFPFSTAVCNAVLQIKKYNFIQKTVKNFIELFESKLYLKYFCLIITFNYKK